MYDIKKNRRKRPVMVENDPWLHPVEREVIHRYNRFKAFLNTIESQWGSLYDFAGAHDFLGIHYDADRKGWVYREWAPKAKALFLMGDFNKWSRSAHKMIGSDSGIWEVFVDEKDYKIEHGSLIKVMVYGENGSRLERIPAYTRRAVQNPETHDFTAQYWAEKSAFDWSEDGYKVARAAAPLIYEAHVGMGQEKEGVGTYREFADEILPRIQKAGYNAIQLMAIQEHPYYGSFGYHVSNFFAPSSRFGEPDDLKYLVKKAHDAGLAVIMDIVHSHAVKNIHEGLNFFDGTDHQYFHAGGRGDHPDWDSKVFNYGKWEVLQFLLSNLRYWIEEFNFDGFRFDGVGSMLYTHHGHASFDHRNKYFREGIDKDAITYLQLAMTLVHGLKPGAICIAEDVTGMPGLCRPVEEGGIGFDYRLAMGIPDFWIKLLKEQRDEDWNVSEMWHVLNDRQAEVGTIAYAESHDQALVGDKTIAFRLMDKEMYTGMSKDSVNMAIDRGISIHKLIRMFTASLGGQAYLNFMGNEFGHPEWIDFPREGNDWSYKYARRQWSLRDKPYLRYEHLADFDEDMIKLLSEHNILAAGFAEKLHENVANQTIAFKRGPLIFLFNFHMSLSLSDYQFYVPEPGKYKIVFNSDEEKYGGFSRLDTEADFFSQYDEEHEINYLSVYNINRAVTVFLKTEDSPAPKKKKKA